MKTTPSWISDQHKKTFYKGPSKAHYILFTNGLVVSDIFPRGSNVNLSCNNGHIKILNNTKTLFCKGLFFDYSFFSLASIKFLIFPYGDHLRFSIDIKHHKWFKWPSNAHSSKSCFQMGQTGIIWKYFFNNSDWYTKRNIILWETIQWLLCSDWVQSVSENFFPFFHNSQNYVKTLSCDAANFQIFRGSYKEHSYKITFLSHTWFLRRRFLKFQRSRKYNWS